MFVNISDLNQQRIYVKFRFILGKTAKETHEALKEGKLSIEDDGMFRKSFAEVNVETCFCP